MSYIHTLPEQVRIDSALMQYTVRQIGIVDYRIRPVFLNGLYHYQSEIERCSDCREPAYNVSLLIEHYRSTSHIAEMYQLPKSTLEEQLNSKRHDAIRYIVKTYRQKTGLMLSSFILLEPVIRFVGDNLQYHVHKLILPQLEQLVDVLQLHVPDYYEKTKAFWAMRLLAAQ
jgi:hypothetical protein